MQYNPIATSSFIEDPRIRTVVEQLLQSMPCNIREKAPVKRDPLTFSYPTVVVKSRSGDDPNTFMITPVTDRDYDVFSTDPSACRVGIGDLNGFPNPQIRFKTPQYTFSFVLTDIRGGFANILTPKLVLPQYKPQERLKQFRGQSGLEVL